MAKVTPAQYWAATYANPASSVNLVIDLDVKNLTEFAKTQDPTIRGPLERILWHVDNLRGR